ncbi:MAG: cytochrome ubiquinol oxidase subunit I [Bacteroidales bacterium]|nr:cytochrome ubiquinol oxidase subunit I [Bacteroidales bacterium]
MLEHVDLSLIDWSRAQFALTAIYHWIFVPLTLGLAFIIAIMESIYVKTGNPEWKQITKFWMTLFGINFAIGVATGIILEFQFGTNWSNYSWFVGDIFGAPLAIEGIMAFFLESTFIAVMFFGWNKVSKRFHLAASWLTAIGANLSALWILVANAWMQFPVGMQFNPDTARNEMVDFWAVLFSPVAINKFFHTITSGYVTASVFVVGISAWFLIKKRHTLLAKRSILIASIFGLASSLFLAFTGDGSAYQVSQKQPMKLAAMEGLYEGKHGAGLVAFGILDPAKKTGDGKEAFFFKIEFPKLLSFLGYRNPDAFVPGVDDIIKGGFTPGYDHVHPMEKERTFSVEEKIRRGKLAVAALATYRDAKVAKVTAKSIQAMEELRLNFPWFGYAYLNSPESIIPNVPLTFYSFHLMVYMGTYFILLFTVVLYLVRKEKLEQQRWLLWLSVWTIPLVYLASEAGWVVAEVGRQPWVIQDLMPVMAAVSKIDATSVIITFWLFAAVFTVLLIAEMMIMIRQIKIGPKDGGTK